MQDFLPDVICPASADGIHPTFRGINEKPGWLQIEIKVVSEADVPK